MLRTAPNSGSRWGLLGGLFDPIHYGHLILAQAAYNHFKFDGLILHPSFNPPHRAQPPVASFEDRCLMTRLALEGHEVFQSSDFEKELKSPGYTIAIIDYLNLKFPGVQWHLILGADNITQFDRWHKPEELVKRVKIVVGNRPGYDDQFAASPWAKYFERFPMPQVEISSTMIRQMVKDKRSIQYLVPEEVRRLVLSRGLYQ
ncbi:MAG: nicotinate (nicotinamide) nucleotide adenylyltransferase [Candidatus Zixiibacteriota bacterium]|jgi:nicotinate-nucleotide adenylyltransferase